MQREVKPEILDELTGDDPRALRSRRDLRLINFLMGNERWILRQLSVGEKLVELGAGAGDFTRQLAKKNEVIGLDFQGPPQDLERNWKEGDLFQTLPEAEGGVVIANLILHHFKEEGLARLGELLKGRDRLVIVEPWRSRLALAEGYGLFPFVN
ncbi:class I SAM-dependent methyltransferase, partial [Akkermansiaceae bacterium]|nr:class I SAM-dependent methyltransferase [Akkermansiaceae bacterium]